MEVVARISNSDDSDEQTNPNKQARGIIRCIGSPWEKRNQRYESVAIGSSWVQTTLGVAHDSYESLYYIDSGRWTVSGRTRLQFDLDLCECSACQLLQKNPQRGMRKKSNARIQFGPLANSGRARRASQEYHSESPRAVLGQLIFVNWEFAVMLPPLATNATVDHRKQGVNGI